MTARSRLFFVLFVAVASVAASAADKPEPSLSLNGYPSQDRMRLKLTLGPGVTRAVRVYSLPSKTLLGVFTNSDGPEPVERSEWFKSTFPADQRGQRFPAAAFEFERGRSVTLSTDRPDPNDNAVAVYVYGLWPNASAANGVDEREDLFTVNTNAQNFRFTISRLDDDTRLCCGDDSYPEGGCKRHCTTCKNNLDLTCCTETDQACGWCGKTKAQCSVCQHC
jgi:hypothetical protein